MRRRIGQAEGEKERIAFPLTLCRARHDYAFETGVHIDDATGKRIITARFDMEAIRRGEPVDLYDGAEDNIVRLRLSVIQASDVVAYSVGSASDPEIGRLIAAFRAESRPSLHLYRADGAECGRLKSIGAWKRFVGLIPFLDTVAALSPGDLGFQPRYTVEIDGRPGLSLAAVENEGGEQYADATVSHAIAHKHLAFGVVDEELVLAGLAALAGHSELGALTGLGGIYVPGLQN